MANLQLREPFTVPVGQFMPLDKELSLLVLQLLQHHNNLMIS